LCFASLRLQERIPPQFGWVSGLEIGIKSEKIVK
jgi:hypothetical protein